MTLSRATALALCSILLAACSSDHAAIPEPTPVPIPDSVVLTLSSADAMTSTGDTRTVTAVIHRTSGAAPQAVTWTTSATNVATVTGTGTTATITAVDDGTATIGMLSGSLQSSVTVTVHRRLASVQVTAPVPVLSLGRSMQMGATALDARGHELTTITSFHWSSNSSSVSLFNTTGLVTAILAFNESHTATISAEATLDGVTATGATAVTAVVPEGFDHASLMERNVPNPGTTAADPIGVAYFSVHGNEIDYVMTWNKLSGPALAAHLHGEGDANGPGPILVDFAPAPSTTTFGGLAGTITAADIHQVPGQPQITIAELVARMGNFSVFLDVHTATHLADGEIRGVVEAIGPFDRRSSFTMRATGPSR